MNNQRNSNSIDSINKQMQQLQIIVTNDIQFQKKMHCFLNEKNMRESSNSDKNYSVQDQQIAQSFLQHSRHQEDDNCSKCITIWDNQVSEGNFSHIQFNSRENTSTLQIEYQNELQFDSKVSQSVGTKKDFQKQDKCEKIVKPIQQKSREACAIKNYQNEQKSNNLSKKKLLRLQDKKYKESNKSCQIKTTIRDKVTQKPQNSKHKSNIQQLGNYICQSYTTLPIKTKKLNSHQKQANQFVKNVNHKFTKFTTVDKIQQKMKKKTVERPKLSQVINKKNKKSLKPSQIIKNKSKKTKQLCNENLWLNFQEGEKPIMERIIKQKQIHKQYTLIATKYLQSCHKITTDIFHTFVEEIKQDQSNKVKYIIKIMSTIVKFFSQFSNHNQLRKQINNQQIKSYELVIVDLNKQILIQILSYPTKLLELMKSLPDRLYFNNNINNKLLESLLNTYETINSQLDKKLELFLIKKSSIFCYLHYLTQYMLYLTQKELIDKTERIILSTDRHHHNIHGYYSSRSKREQNKCKNTNCSKIHKENEYVSNRKSAIDVEDKVQQKPSDRLKPPIKKLNY